MITDGSQSSQPDTVNITVNPPNIIALQASVPASSQNTSTGQPAAKGIDGYPGD